MIPAQTKPFEAVELCHAFQMLLVLFLYVDFDFPQLLLIFKQISVFINWLFEVDRVHRRVDVLLQGTRYVLETHVFHLHEGAL